MADSGNGTRDDWASAAYRLFATGMSSPLGVDIAVRTTGLDLPDAALDGLCVAIMGDLGRETNPQDA